MSVEISPTFRAKRYGDLAFPPYRFVPGLHPHPTKGPDGHSYHYPDEPPEEIVPIDPDRWQESADYLYGADLYNHGYWWESHEAWEGIWQLTDKRRATGQFLQGLIQTSAVHLKFHLGHGGGFSRLRTSSLNYFAAVRDELGSDCFMGVDLRDWLERVAVYYQGRELGDRHDAEYFPYLILNWDL